MMLYLELFWGFLKVGLFSFGGAYGAIPLIREIVLSYGWLDDGTLADMIAVSESTPGPIMVNLATYVGSSRGGVPGAILSTFAVVLPAFVIILLLMAVLKRLLQHRLTQSVLKGLEAAVAGIILATGAWMLWENCSRTWGGKTDWRSLVIAAVLAGVMLSAKPLFKKKLSPIVLIGIAAALGGALYSV